jgi:hypothetical protein
MDKVADSIVVAPDDLNNHDSVTRKSDRPRKMTTKAMEYFAGNAGPVVQAMIREIRDQILKQTAKIHEDTVKEITKAHERTIETLWGAWREEQQALKQMVANQEKALEQLREDIQSIRAQSAQERELMQQQLKQMQEHTPHSADELKGIHDRLDAIALQLTTSPTQTYATPSYADVALARLASPPSGTPRPSTMRTAAAETLFCTIDTSRVSKEDKSKAQIGEIRQAIEEEVRKKEDRQGWRCTAVLKDTKSADRIKVICRDEKEMSLVKEAAEKTTVRGVRVLRDQLYPVKVDGANRTAVLDAEGNILPGAMEVLGEENNVTISKLHWLSDKANGKMYGSMVVYVTKANDARRLLEERYFHLAGESASTNVYERRQGPAQCYKCWHTGHKAFACQKEQVCGRCAQRGHQHRECQVAEPSCTRCGGPHEAFSRNCRARTAQVDGQ